MLIEAERIDAFYGPGQVLHGCTVTVGDGECLALLGRNGAGKTTLVHVLAGLHAARGGRVVFDGVDITALPPEKRLRAGIALVPQGHRVFRSLTVEQNLEVAVRRSEGGWSISDVYDRFQILGQRQSQLAGNLSGGQQQMLAVGRAMVANARLILMDEPSEGLDPQRVALVGSIIDEIRARGSAVLLVEQRVKFAVGIADRVAFMSRGEITEEYPSSVVREDPTIVTRALGLTVA